MLHCQQTDKQSVKFDNACTTARAAGQITEVREAFAWTDSDTVPLEPTGSACYIFKVPFTPTFPAGLQNPASPRVQLPAV